MSCSLFVRVQRRFRLIPLPSYVHLIAGFCDVFMVHGVRVRDPAQTDNLAKAGAIATRCDETGVLTIAIDWLAAGRPVVVVGVVVFQRELSEAKSDPCLLVSQESRLANEVNVLSCGERNKASKKITGKKNHA